jgi:hypothetical protein
MELIHTMTRQLAGTLTAADIPVLLPVLAGIAALAVVGWRVALGRKGDRT